MVRQLVAEGVDTVFGVPGYQIMHIYDGFFDSPEIRLVTCRHEQSAVFAADGYARTTGKVGVALIVPGPGAYNAGAAMATAKAANSPVLLVSGQMASHQIGREQGALHEVNDQLDIMRPVTKWVARLQTPREVPKLVHEAFHQLKTGRPQPVELEMPHDYLAQALDYETIEREEYPLPSTPSDLIVQAAQLLAEARRPLIYAGDGVLRAGGTDELEGLAARLGAPVLLSRDARGALPDYHPLAFSSPLKTYGDPETTSLISEADVVLVVGGRFAGIDGERWEIQGHQKLVYVDIDPMQLSRANDPTVLIEAEARVAMVALREELEGRHLSSGWDTEMLAEVHERRKNKLRLEFPEQIKAMEELRAVLPDDTIVIGGVTVGARWIGSGFDIVRPGTLLSSSYMTTLGCGFPTGLGAKVGNPDTPVISLSGDGGLLYAIGDLATAVQNGVNLVTLVFNNGKFGASQYDQTDGRFGGRVIGTDLLNPDFVALAEAFGALGLRVERLDDLPRTVAHAVDAGRPVLVDVTGDAMAALDFPI